MVDTRMHGQPKGLWTLRQILTAVQFVERIAVEE